LLRDLLQYLCDLRFHETRVIELLGLQHPLNKHLIKLAGLIFPRERRQHFRAEIRSWLNKLQRQRMKPNNPTGSAKFYSDLLFDYPSGGLSVRICGY
jgi:hypothetical protein